MNTLLVVTRNNLEEMKSVSRELGERQKSSNAGKLLITGGYYLDDDSLREIAEPLSNCYEVTELTKVQVSPNQADATKIAVLGSLLIQDLKSIRTTHCRLLKNHIIRRIRKTRVERLLLEGGEFPSAQF